MKTTDNFKRVITEYLKQRADFDELFAVSFAKPHKNIDDCVTYILNWVQKSGCAGFCDDEIFSQAVHYYDEDSIEIGNPIDCKVAVNHIVEITEEEKEQARKDAIEQVQREYRMQLTKRKTPAKPKVQELTNTPSLFDLYDNETKK